MIELNGENYLDGHEASHLLGVKLSTLYTYVSRGVLRSYKQGIKRKRNEVTSSSLEEDVQREPGLPYAEDWIANA